MSLLRRAELSKYPRSSHEKTIPENSRASNEPSGTQRDVCERENIVRQSFCHISRSEHGAVIVKAQSSAIHGPVWFTEIRGMRLVSSHTYPEERFHGLKNPRMPGFRFFFLRDN